MEVYYCSGCQFTTTLKANYERHLTTKKHKKMYLLTQKQPEQINVQSQSAICKYCNKLFTFKNSMYRHVKYRCAKNKAAVLLNIQYDKKKQLEMQQTQIELKQKQIELQQKQIDKLQIQINNIHYNLLPYQKTDTSHLTDEDFIQCVNQANCVKLLIQKIHFNPTKPENISNLKDDL